MGTLLTSLKKYNEKKEDIVEQRREKKETGAKSFFVFPFHRVFQAYSCGGGGFRDLAREVPQPHPAH